MENAQQKAVQFSTDEFRIISDVAVSFLQRGVSENPPKFVIFMGGVGVGKTTIRREKYAEGYVHLDFGEIHLALEKTVDKSYPRLAEYALFASEIILRESISD